MSVESKPKGRPPLEPRIAELERKLEALEKRVNAYVPGIPRPVEYQSAFDKWPTHGNQKEPLSP